MNLMINSNKQKYSSNTVPMFFFKKIYDMCMGTLNMHDNKLSTSNGMFKK